MSGFMRAITGRGRTTHAGSRTETAKMQGGREGEREREKERGDRKRERERERDEGGRRE